MKKLIISVMTLSLFVLFPNLSDAHPLSSPNCQPGGELLGYLVDCNNHQSTNSFSYYIPNSFSTAYITGVSDGASAWYPTVSITRNFSITSPNQISTYTDVNTSTVASFYDYSSNSSGHLTKWKISMNTHHMDGFTSLQKKKTIAHELGHAVGLNDLQLSGNKDKLMYAFEDRTATSATAKDILGALEATKH